MTVNWMNNDYLSLLLSKDSRAYGALELCVDDLHAEKEKTINHFLCHSGSEDFLWGLVRLLGNENSRVSGNAAYIVGTLAESDIGCYRVLGLLTSPLAEARLILTHLTRMLQYDDAESVMNAAGTMGTLAESNEGRDWMLSEACLPQTLDNVTALLTSDNLWTASNAALVLARLTISEDGCSKILLHKNSAPILSCLVSALGVDEAGRGMNAAFALGRLCDLEAGRNRLLQLPESEMMISSLAKMLMCQDLGASKNACFALSCLATNKDGHMRILRNTYSDDVLRTLAQLLTAPDPETGWFAAMTLRTLASQPKGCLRLREHPAVVPALKAVEESVSDNEDLHDEVVHTLEILKPLDRPATPTITVEGPHHIAVTWQEIESKSGLPISYQLYDGAGPVYSGQKTSWSTDKAEAASDHVLKVRAVTEGDGSPWSTAVTVTTEEAVPTAPLNLRIIGQTATQLKVGWDPPAQPNGAIKGYYVYNAVPVKGKESSTGRFMKFNCGRQHVEHTTELTGIVSGLQASTAYDISVCASTNKGKGVKATCTGTTNELGEHAPSRPEVRVLGRHELHVTWKPPELPLGRINSYEVHMNKTVMYSGTDLSYTARTLKSDTEYTVTVCAMTGAGKCESKPSRARTHKDEFEETKREPLYKPPERESTSLHGDTEKPPPNPKKKKTTLETPHKLHRSVTSAGSKSTFSSSSRPGSGVSVNSKKGKHTDHESAERARSHVAESRRGSLPSRPRRENTMPPPAGPPLLGERQTTKFVSKTTEFKYHNPNDRGSVSTISLALDGSTPPPVTSGTPPEAARVRENTVIAVDRLSIVSDTSQRPPERPPLSPLRKPRGDALRGSVELEKPENPLFRLADEQTSSRRDGRKKPAKVTRKSFDGMGAKLERERTKLASSRGASFTELYGDSKREIHRSQTMLLPEGSSPSSSSTPPDVIARDVMPPRGKHAPPQQLPPELPRRTNTFVSSHRPGRSDRPRSLHDSITSPSGGAGIFKPDFPQPITSNPQTNVRKFVPTQFRVQPRNLPPSLHRELTSSGRLEGLSRSTTQVELPGHRGTSVNIPDIGYFTVNPTRASREHFLGGQGSISHRKTVPQSPRT